MVTAWFVNFDIAFQTSCGSQKKGDITFQQLDKFLAKSIDILSIVEYSGGR